VFFFSCFPGGTLQLLDLAEDDWTSFASAIKALAIKLQQRPGAFEHFLSWLERRQAEKGHTIAIDAANIALYGENWEEGSFKFRKVRVVYEALQKAHPKARVLVVSFG
jgi:proteinaceous RNase P